MATVAFRRPVLSICVTTFNRAAWLRQSVPLILEQARPYRGIVEVAVCDNASTDETPTVCEALARSANVRIHRNATNVGMLGNLAVSVQQARGEYAWIIGDDDLMVPGALERVLAAIALHPDVDLVYTNYASTCFDVPEDLSSPDEVIRGGTLNSTHVRDEYSPRLGSICTRSDNCFTGIYCLVFRTEHARQAYGQDTRGPPFSSLPTCVPSTHYILDHMLDRPAYWVGDPCVVVNRNVSWSRYAALYVLERFPEIWDRMEIRGVDPVEVDGLRARFLPHLAGALAELYFGSQREHVADVSIERLVRRFVQLSAFPRHWPSIREIYARAFRTGCIPVTFPSPESLDDLVSEAAPATRLPGQRSARS
jgi:glycosyltransferase involved in cell wall biosynthesis